MKLKVFLLPFRRVYSTKMFIIPVILFSILYNISKFWELDIYEERSLTFSNGTTVPEKRLTNETIAANEPLNVTVYLEPTDLRKNSLYIRIYILWMNLIFNILGPFIVLATLNHIVSIVYIQKRNNAQFSKYVFFVKCLIFSQ